MKACEICGKPATRTVVDMIEINGGHVAGKEHLPPAVHKQHAPAHTCDEHAREPKVVKNDALHAIRDGWTGKYPAPTLPAAPATA